MKKCFRSPLVALSSLAAALLAAASIAAGCAQPVAEPLKNLSQAELAAAIKALTQPSSLTTAAASAIADTQVVPEALEKSESGTNAKGVPVTYKTYTSTFKASAAYNELVLLNPSSDVIYPGSVILGSSIDDGSYKEVTEGTKKAVTLSFDLSGVTNSNGQAGIVSGSIVPTLSNYRELRNKILGQTIPKQTSTYAYEMIEAKSESEFDLKVDAGVSYKGASIKASLKAGFDYSSSSKTNKILVKFMQTFYTVDVDQGNGTFLYDSIDTEAFGGYQPVYVASIAYGRLAYLTIESSSDFSTIKSYLDAMLKYGNTSSTITAAEAASFFSSNAKTNIMVIGASVVATDLSSFLKMIADDQFSDSNAGKIIAYKLRFVHNNSVANTVFNGDYVVRRTEEVLGGGVDLTLRVTRIDSSINDGTTSTGEFYGDVLFKKSAGDALVEYLWSYGSDGYYSCGVNSQNDYNGPSQTINFNSLNDSFYVAVSGLNEEDDTIFDPDDPFSSPSMNPKLSELTSGTPFTITATDNSDNGEFLRFYIMPTIAVKY